MSVLRFRSADASPSASSRLKTSPDHRSFNRRDSRACFVGEPLLAITPFESDWEDVRTRLVEIARDIEAGVLPLTVSEAVDEEDDDDSPVSSEMLQNLIQHYRDIELQTERDSMLELGEIGDPFAVLIRQCGLDASLDHSRSVPRSRPRNRKPGKPVRRSHCTYRGLCDSTCLYCD